LIEIKKINDSDMMATVQMAYYMEQAATKAN
jgi:hypothetical protein